MIRNAGLIYPLLLLLLALPAFAQRPAPPYRFAEPDATLPLHRSLREISGLDVVNDSLLAAVQDERGAVFLLRIRDGTIAREIPFGAPDDYEGITVDGFAVYLIASRGTIVHLDDWRAEAPAVRVLETGLSARHDFEGIAADGGRLLIACKACTGGDLDRAKAVFAVDPATGRADPEPVYRFDTSAFRQASRESPINAFVRRLADPLIDLSGFHPSGLARHPISGHLLVLSSGHRAIAVVDSSGTIVDVWPLPQKLFAQPEGIAVLPNGDLFVSTEGDIGLATLVRFNYRP